jgi:hypothetical protein
VPDSIQVSNHSVSKGFPAAADRRAAEHVILEILTQLVSLEPKVKGLSRWSLSQVFWFAHLHYMKSNPGYLTTWPLIRTSWGVEIGQISGLLRELIEEDFLQAEQVEIGPFPVTIYQTTTKAWESELSAAAVQAIQQAIRDDPYWVHSSAHRFPVYSRAWRETREGEEMDISLDLIPEDVYEERRQQMEGLKDALGDLFS